MIGGSVPIPTDPLGYMRSLELDADGRDYVKSRARVAKQG
jgi:hypothetical protein